MPETFLHKKLLLKRLRHEVVSAAEDAKQKEKAAQFLANLISGALFLEEEPERKKMWIEAIPLLSQEEMEILSQAIVRENLRWKKGHHDLHLHTHAPKILTNIS